MFSSEDLQRRAYLRRAAVVALAVAAYTFAANLATFAGHPGLLRLLMFGLAGLLAATVALVGSASLKKMPS
jgi:hypothetical protein